MSLKAKLITDFSMRRSSLVTASVDRNGKILNIAAEKMTAELQVNSLLAIHARNDKKKKSTKKAVRHLPALLTVMMIMRRIQGPVLILPVQMKPIRS